MLMYVSSIDACTNPTQIKSSRRVPLPIGRSVKLARGDRCMITAQLTAASALMRMPSTTCGDSGRAWLNSERERAAAVRAMPASTGVTHSPMGRRVAFRSSAKVAMTPMSTPAMAQIAGIHRQFVTSSKAAVTTGNTRNARGKTIPYVVNAET